MSWGLGPWGLTGWGSAPGDLFISNAVAISTNTIRVYLSTECAALSSIDIGDGLNRFTWRVRRLDTLEQYTVLDAQPVDSPATWDLRVLEPLQGSLIQHEVSALQLLKETGTPIVAPKSFVFYGVLDVDLATPDAQIATQGFATRDLANPAVPLSGSSIGGVMKIAGGDYKTETGAELLKKLILRRVTTKLASFTHLPDYGIGLRVKEPLPTNNLIGLKVEIERQVRQEPEVRAVQAQLLLGNNTLQILLSVQTEPEGTQIELPLNVPLGNL